ncbi:hypothetical protein F0562_030561 [Nyssa sinensis]|uniref:non-specific serine/threonine protein kinase n=1 Tax=Nyssa sinensis TaxID=561372 RepID=A0A5J5AX90_9ASTE|nr:hypothetical protein F0562_030561 [Nyssa sinensis]
MELLLGVLVVQSCMVCLAFSLSNLTDQSALLAIKNEIKIEPNNILDSNWTTTTSFCNWVGVSCSRRRQRVTALNLSYMGLQGTISPHVGNLSFLVALDLRNNSFHGSLTHEIGRLGRLKVLILQDNKMEGIIPLTLFHCRKLEFLSLRRNTFNGGISEELGTLPELRILDLRGNNFMGTIPPSLGNLSTLRVFALEDNAISGSIPWTIFNISSFRVVGLTNNSISGSLPMDICQLCPRFEALLLSENLLGGQIPSLLSNCSELRRSSLSFNKFEGSIPRDIGSLRKLELLYLDSNNFEGTLPPSLGNISSLLKLAIAKTYIRGQIPPELARLSNLRMLSFGDNSLTGILPEQIFNISSLQKIYMGFNSLDGNLPTCFWLPNLEVLDLGVNRLRGHIPSYLSNSSKLSGLSLAYNLFTGPVPTSLGNLQLLRVLSIVGNHLTTENESSELSFLTALTQCKLLEVLAFGYNPMDGILPNSIGNFSSSLQVFFASGCQIRGPIPREIGSLKNLNFLQLSNNNVNGSIPSSIGGLESLQKLYLDGNKIEGLIPDEICHLSRLGILFLQDNNLLGRIPDCIGNLRSLAQLFLSSNNLNSSIPMSLWTLENLLFLNLSSNSLGGELPLQMRMSNVMNNMDLSRNHIEGSIPSTIGSFKILTAINLSRNSFKGSIPESFGVMVGLEFIDLSYNNISGTIPKSLEALRSLKYLNLSYNKLSGEIPNRGPFVNFAAESFMGNEALCGQSFLQIPTCKIHNSQKMQIKQIFLKYILPIIASIVLVVSFTYIVIKYRGRKTQTPNLVDLAPIIEHKRISYQELRDATNNFCDANLLGVGSFASVFKGVLADGIIVAVKILNLELDGAFKSFDAECKVLRNIRHRNLVKVISSCSNLELRALVLQYMSNGSLEKWLYSHNYCLDLFQRVSIIFDVALALEYLHHGQSEVVVHCDLKPNNVLLDEDMVAHVGDFGIAKIMAQNKTETQTKTLGTIGYIAPEYGSEGRVSTKGDIYSYGIMLLEMFTRKKPTDEMFTGELSMRQWVRASLPSKLMEVVDGGLFTTRGGMTTTQALLAFKSKIRFDPTNVLAHNWTTSTNFCHWIGVTCSTHRQRVTVLDLGYMGPQGTISPHLANLSFLVLLDLSNNSFQGQLPPEFSHLCRLKELNLAHNQIEGVIPPSLYHCRRLQAILLEYNNFTSGIPKEFGILPKLRGLSLGGNSLSGSIPSSIGNIYTLEYLESESSSLAEYGSKGRVSTRGDIFSYGIMLLETFTRKKPTDEMFTGELSLRHWVNASLLDNLIEVMDCGLLRMEKGDMTATQDSVLAIMELGLECCKELPEERNDIQEVVSKLNKIKL